MIGLLAGTHTLLVGVEDEPTGGLRLYLGHRGRGLYAVVEDADVIKEIRDAWAGGGMSRSQFRRGDASTARRQHLAAKQTPIPLSS